MEEDLANGFQSAYSTCLEERNVKVVSIPDSKKTNQENIYKDGIEYDVTSGLEGCITSGEEMPMEPEQERKGGLVKKVLGLVRIGFFGGLAAKIALSMANPNYGVLPDKYDTESGKELNGSYTHNMTSTQMAKTTLGSTFGKYTKGVLDSIDAVCWAGGMSASDINNQGLLYMSKGNNELAIEKYKEAIDVDPSYQDAYNNLGVAYNNIGKNNLAVEVLEKAIQLDDVDPAPYGNIAFVYRDMKKYDLAIDMVKKYEDLMKSQGNLDNDNKQSITEFIESCK